MNNNHYLARAHQLVKRLSTAEKKYIQHRLTRSATNGSTLRNAAYQLFLALDNQEAYCEADLTAQYINSQISIEQISKYLYNKILAHMNNAPTKSALENQLREWLGNVFFLTEKSLYEQAYRILIRAKKQALKHEKLSILPEILYWQKKLLELMFFSNKSEAKIKHLYQQELEILEKLRDINDLWQLQARLYYHHYHQGIAGSRTDIDKVSDILQTVLLKEQEVARSFEAQLLLYRIYATYFFIIRDFSNCYNYSNKLIVLLEQYPDVLHNDAILYVQSLNNLLNMTIPLGKSHERQQYLQKLRLLIDSPAARRSEKLQIKLFEVYGYHQMNEHIAEGSFAEGMPLVTQISNGLQQYAGRIDQMGEVMLCFYAFHITFGAKQYEQAYYWLNRILNLPPNEIRQDIYTFSHLLQLLTCYEIGNADLTRRQIKRCYAFLLHHPSQYRLETAVLQLLRHLPDMPNYHAFIVQLRSLKAQLLAWQDDTFERKIFAYFDFLQWTTDKLLQYDLNHAPTIPTTITTA